MTHSAIPAFLNIDVEPDGFQLDRSTSSQWHGFEALCSFIQELRTDLRKRCGQAPRFGWSFRTDPQIAEVCGRASYVLEAFADQLAQLEAQGDYFGVHMHPLRWSETHGLWVHDFADREWLRYSTRFALQAFADWAGTPVRRFRSGAGFLNNDILATLEEMEVSLDLTLEPVAGWGLAAKSVPSGIDESPIVGSFLDCRDAPREAYRPSVADFRVPDRKSGRRLVVLPLTTYELPEPTPEKTGLIGRLCSRFASKPRRPAQVLYPGLQWPSPTYFWDLAARQLSSMRRPYLSLAIRTDAPEQDISKRERSLLKALVAHPLSKRLVFVDPLEAMAGLIS